MCLLVPISILETPTVTNESWSVFLSSDVRVETSVSGAL